MFSALLILAGLVLLTGGGELLVRGASSIAARLGVQPFIIGLTVVGFGTSAPEMGTSVAAALRGASDIVVGNVVGSNMFNIAVILGLTGLLAPVAVDRRAVRTELLWTLAAACAPWLALIGAFEGNAVIGRPVAAVLLAGIGAYLLRAFLEGRRDPSAPEPAMEAELASLAQRAETPERPAGVLASCLFTLAGLALLVAGAKLLVDGSIDIARSLGVSELVIGLTIVAAGTSLPELVTSVIAAARKKPELAIGNILGSNVFNSFAILGVASMVAPPRVSTQTLRFDTPVMLGFTLLLAAVCLGVGRLGRLTGAGFLALYGGYLAALLSVG